METLNLPRQVFYRILDTIGAFPAESGGVFALRNGDTVAAYYFDRDAGTGNRFYRPTAPRITAQVNTWLREPGLCFGGYIHSHPAGHTTLSPMDIVAAEMTLYQNRLPQIHMLLLCEGKLYGYRITPRPQEAHPAVKPCAIRITG